MLANPTKHRLAIAALILTLSRAWCGTNVYLTEVPDYNWWAGCFGTATGNLMGFWDRHGFPNFYTGPTAEGVAPLNAIGLNSGILSLWASQAGFDGRPDNQFGHYDDYYVDYESTAPDPYLAAGRTEHSPDCLGDFIGLSQWKWTNMAGECDGNLDGFCFAYWDASGDKRVNDVPSPEAGLPALDIPSGLRAWTQYRGSHSLVFNQLADVNPHTPPNHGFTFEDLRAEIDAGYPVLLLLQKHDEFSRTIGSQARANPEVHGMVAYGYYLTDEGTAMVRYRTSWASGDNCYHAWDSQPWEANLPLRGVIGYHPLPQIVSCSYNHTTLTLQWEGPAAELYDSRLPGLRQAHAYLVEMTTDLAPANFQPVSPVLTEHSFVLTNCPSPAFFRLKLVTP